MSPAFPDILTVDVEDWFHILEADGAHRREDWPALEARVERNTDRLLELFDETGARATFFVVGWVAERHPDLVRRIVAAGHEVASHSWWHEVLRRHDRASLRADLLRSKQVLEDLAGAPVAGFRAPGGSLTEETIWALDVLVETGFQWDSSIWPGYASHGGFSSPFAGPHRIRTVAGELVEIPASTFGVRGWRVPYAGGGYLRLFPHQLVELGMALDRRRGRPTNIYVHPREIDPEQPRMPLSWARRFKYYVGLRSTEPKLTALLARHRFVPMGEWIENHRAEWSDHVLDVRERARVACPRPDPALVPPPPPGRDASEAAPARAVSLDA